MAGARQEETPRRGSGARIARIRLNERESSELGYARDLVLTRRHLTTDEQGSYVVVGEPEGDVYAGHLDIAVAGLPEGQETNPVRRGVMFGTIFVIDGEILDRAGQPVVPIAPVPDDIADRAYAAHTEYLERLQRNTAPAPAVKRRRPDEAMKVEAEDLLSQPIRQIQRALTPRVNNVQAREKDYLLTLLNYMYYRELEADAPRKGLVAILRDGICRLGPDANFILNVMDDDG
jgi:hypothetical protein